MATRDSARDFPFVEPPKRWKTSLWIEHEPGSRRWVGGPDAAAFRQWMDELQEALPGNLIPLTWVADYVGVSRESVTRRVEAGRLTVFIFEFEEAIRSVFKRTRRTRTRQRFEFLALSECRAWREDVWNRYDVDESEKKKRR